VRLSVLAANLRAMGVAGIKGQVLAQRSFVRIVEVAEQARIASEQEYLEVVLGYKAYWEEELNRRRVLNISAPDPIPHPDDIIINPRAGDGGRETALGQSPRKHEGSRGGGGLFESGSGADRRRMYSRNALGRRHARR
jgi:hypothetical protein